MDARDDLPAALARQLDALTIERDRPLIAVDADEVLVVFVDHLSRYIAGLGYEMRLDTWQLEGSIFEAETGDMVPFEGCIELIDRFFAAETAQQQPVPGGKAALDRLAERAQIVILTNVPAHGAEARRRNLDALGLTWPMIVNSGGKGRAMAWLAEACQAPIALVDDSSTQLQNVARDLPDSVRLHFIWAPFLQRLFPECPHATRQVRDWTEAEAALVELLGL